MITTSLANDQNLKKKFDFSKEEIRSADNNRSLVVVGETSKSALGHYFALKNMVEILEEKLDFSLVQKRYPKIIVKLDADAAPGLFVSSKLLDATLTLLKSKGYSKEKVMIMCFEYEKLKRSVGYNEELNDSGYKGHKVSSPEDLSFFHPEWYHESSMPPRIHDRAKFFISFRNDLKKRIEEERKSYLPAIFLEKDTYWINLSVAMDDPYLGISAASGNLSLGMATNAKRFQGDPTIGSAAVAEILAIPEIWNKRLFSIIDLTKYQFAGGTQFSSEFIASEPTLLISRNPFAADFIAWDFLSRTRVRNGFSLRVKNNALIFKYAESLGLGNIFETEVVSIPVSGETGR